MLGQEYNTITYFVNTIESSPSPPYTYHMNPEAYKQSEPAKKPIYERPIGTPVKDGWVRTGNYFTKELPTGGIQKLSLQEWEKMEASKGHRETVSKGLELQALEKQRLEREEIQARSLRSAREALHKEFGKLKPGQKEIGH